MAREVQGRLTGGVARADDVDIEPVCGRGVGTLLARELATAARAVGIRRFAATMLSDNEAIRHLMGTISAHLELDTLDSGLREVVIDLAA